MLHVHPQQHGPGRVRHQGTQRSPSPVYGAEGSLRGGQPARGLDAGPIRQVEGPCHGRPHIPRLFPGHSHHLWMLLHPLCPHPVCQTHYHGPVQRERPQRVRTPNARTPGQTPCRRR